MGGSSGDVGAGLLHFLSTTFVRHMDHCCRTYLDERRKILPPLKWPCWPVGVPPVLVGAGAETARNAFLVAGVMAVACWTVLLHAICSSSPELSLGSLVFSLGDASSSAAEVVAVAGLEF